MLYIYGNSHDIDITSTASANSDPIHNAAKTIVLGITGITNPYAKWTTYTGWEVHTQRF